MLQLLKESVSSRHAERLEQIVIVLIAIEIGPESALGPQSTRCWHVHFLSAWHHYYPRGSYGVKTQAACTLDYWFLIDTHFPWAFLEVTSYFLNHFPDLCLLLNWSRVLHLSPKCDGKSSRVLPLQDYCATKRTSRLVSLHRVFGNRWRLQIPGFRFFPPFRLPAVGKKFRSAYRLQGVELKKIWRYTNKYYIPKGDKTN